MKKETSIAIGMGIVFGLIFSFVVILNTQKNNTVTQKKQPQKVRPAGTTEKQTLTQPITISSPNDGAIIDSASVTIKGTVEKNSFVIVQSSAKDATFTADKAEFSYNLPLTLGENVIRLSAYPKGAQGKIQEKELKVYYLNTK